MAAIVSYHSRVWPLARSGWFWPVLLGLTIQALWWDMPGRSLTFSVKLAFSIKQHKLRQWNSVESAIGCHRNMMEHVWTCQTHGWHTSGQAAVLGTAFMFLDVVWCCWNTLDLAKLCQRSADYVSQHQLSQPSDAIGHRNMMEHVNIMADTSKQASAFLTFSCFWMLDAVWCCYSHWRKQKERKSIGDRRSSFGKEAGCYQ